MKILIAPIHYVINNTDGSEYTRSYENLVALARDTNLHGDVLVGYSDKKRMGNFTIHSLWSTKPGFISIARKLQFVWWIALTSKKLQRTHNYDVIWHQGPFAIGETFSLIALTKNKNQRFVIGPIYTPFKNLKTKDSGNYQKDSSGNITRLSLKNRLDYFLYQVFCKLCYPLSLLTLKRADHVIAIENKGLELLRSIGISPSSVIPLTIDSTGFSVRPRTMAKPSCELLSVGYLVDRKRMEDAIAAISILVWEYKKRNIHLTIIGDGPEMNNHKTQIKKLNLNKYITLAGYVPRQKIHSYYKKADIFISASVMESMPGMYFEAMNAALPMVLATNSTSEELEKIKFGGHIVPVYDPPKIAHAIDDLMDVKNVYKKFSERNYELANSEFNYEQNINALKSVLQGSQPPMSGRIV